MLEIKNIHVSAGETDILKDFSLSIPPGQVCAVMGPNGSGKSTLTQTLAGSPDYHISSGNISYLGQDLLVQETHERSRNGIFVAFQQPVSIPGVNNLVFLKTIYNTKRKYQGLPELDAADFIELVSEKTKMVGLDESFWERSLNEDFSGGEKRNDILQMLLLEPKLMILDETDSGLDIDAMKLVAKSVNQMRAEDKSFLVISHYSRLFEYIKPDIVHVLVNGRIVESGDYSLVAKLETEGYHWLQQTV